jgi:hypothetical protein
MLGFLVGRSRLFPAVPGTRDRKGTAAEALAVPLAGSVHWTDWESDLGGLADADGAGEQLGVQRRGHAKVVLPPALTAATVRTIVREELAVVREDIKTSGRRAFWSGFGQGLLFYVCGVGFTLIISG